MAFNNIKNLLKEGIFSAVDTISECTGYVAISDRLDHPDSRDVITLDIPGYRQTNTFSCAVTAGLMVLHTFHPRASVNSFYHAVNPSIEMGADSGQLIRALRRFRIGVSECDQLLWKDILETVSGGYPIITLVKSNDPDILHWVVLYGVGIRPNRVYVAGRGLPLIGKRAFLWREFRQLWADPGYGLVCWGK